MSRRSTEAQSVVRAVNRPDDSKWSQQKLPMWKPILTLKWAIGILFSVAIACLVLGVLVLRGTKELSVYRVVYDDTVLPSIVQEGGSVAQLTNCHLKSLSDANSFSGARTCYVTITLEKDFVGDGRVFYELAPFYQNHRRLVASQEPTQLLDLWSTTAYETSACEPLITASSKYCNGTVCNGPEGNRQLYPCGLVANTMFNDIIWFDLYTDGNSSSNTRLHNGTLPTGDSFGHGDLNHTGIARNFLTYGIINPTMKLDLAKYLPIWHNPNYSRIIPTPGADNLPQINPDYSNSTAWTTTPPGTGLENEWFRVWYDVAATPTVRKLYGHIDKAKLVKGATLTFAVQSNFFAEGAKSIVLAEVGWFGSENTRLGAAFLITGSMCMIAGIAFLFRYLRNPRKLGDVSALKWKLH
ncbi:kinase [Thraustotheca clavata]|uniref:Kinase n=1 Tax=Thraustotheca clavata TaxID=74557 RepID=A0A1V9ZZS0_9STRA|nr:kinase [Thraustotheca clavata]